MIFSCDIRKEGYENVNRYSGFDELLCFNQHAEKYFVIILGIDHVFKNQIYHISKMKYLEN